jgi:hypothetical protein
MRLRPIEQMATKVAVALDDSEPDMATLVRQRLPNVHHQMWNGQWHAAIARMKLIYQGVFSGSSSSAATARASCSVPSKTRSGDKSLVGKSLADSSSCCR